MSNTSLTIAVDAMGCDLGPSVVVDGVMQALTLYPGVKIILVGSEDVIRYELAKYSENPQVSILHAPEIITPDEVPTSAIRQKKGSSLVVWFRVV